MSIAKTALQNLARRIVADYRINFVYGAPPPGFTSGGTVPLQPSTEYFAMLDASSTPKVRNAASFARAGMEGWVVLDRGRPVSVAHLADCAQYDRGSTWPLRPGEMALMDIATEEAERGRGLAVELIGALTHFYQGRGCPHLIAFVWWSNRPSIRAVEKAGWRRIGLSIEVLAGSNWRGLRIPLGWLPSGSRPALAPRPHEVAR